MWEAVETVACLACVCVAEVVEGRRRRGYQWATAGVPQSQPSTCCYHNRQAGPWPGTNSLSVTEVQAVDFTHTQTLLASCPLLYPSEPKLSACFPPLLSFMSAGLLTCRPRLVTETENSTTSCNQAQWRAVSSLIFSINKTSSTYLYATGSNGWMSRSCPSLQLPTFVCTHVNTYYSVFSRPSMPSFSVYVYVSSFCETSCVCLLYLVNLLQESRQPAAAPSFHIHSVRPPSLPGGLQVCLRISRRWVYSQVTFSWSWCVWLCAHVEQFVPSLSSSIWPVARVDSTCVRLLIYLLQESRLLAAEQSHHISSVKPRAGRETKTSSRCLSVRQVFCFV